MHRWRRAYRWAARRALASVTMLWPLALAWMMRSVASTKNIPAVSVSEIVGQGRGLNGFEIDNLADKNGTADMRYDKCEPATHLVVSEAVG